MPNLEELGEVVSADVLIVGGGFGGLPAAIRLKELHPELDILVVDKANIGYGGGAPKVGGSLAYFGPDDSLDEIMEYHVKNLGCYLTDQEMFAKMYATINGGVELLSDWGTSITRDEKGNFIVNKMEGSGGVYSITGCPVDVMEHIYFRAKEVGLRLMDKIQVLEIIKNGDTAVGAVGVGLLDSKCYIFKAKAQVWSTSSCTWKMHWALWNYGCGEGVAAAWRAGAEMRNAEFGVFADPAWKDHFWINSLYAAGTETLHNAKGDEISKAFKPDDWEDGFPELYAAVVAKELSAGNGPVFADYSRNPVGHSHTDIHPISENAGKMKSHEYGHSSKNRDYHGYNLIKARQYGPQMDGQYEMYVIGGMFTPINVDHEMRTTVPGLWAIGDLVWSGSGFIGAQGQFRRIGNGWGLGNALCTALISVPTVAEFAKNNAMPEIDYSEAKRLKDEIFAPLYRDSKGAVTTHEAQWAAQETFTSLNWKYYKSKDRLEKALARTAEVKDFLNYVKADDGHGLLKYHEAKSMALCSEIYYAASMARTETRAQHVREDYPERDDKNWLKWVICKEDNGRPATRTAPVPIERYKFKPAGYEGR